MGLSVEWLMSRPGGSMTILHRSVVKANDHIMGLSALTRSMNTSMLEGVGTVVESVTGATFGETGEKTGRAFVGLILRARETISVMWVSGPKTHIRMARDSPKIMSWGPHNEKKSYRAVSLLSNPLDSWDHHNRCRPWPTRKQVNVRSEHWRSTWWVWEKHQRKCPVSGYMLS